MAVKTFSVGETLTASDTNTYLANSGLVYVAKQTVGTGVSSVTVSNCFNSTWTNYRVIYTGGVASNNCDLKMTVGSIVAGYYGAAFGAKYADGTVKGLGVNNAASWLYAGTGTTGYAVLDCDLLMPYLTQNTFILSRLMFNFTDSAYSSFNGELANTSSVNSLTITPSSGTLTGGTITVYGYRLG